MTGNSSRFDLNDFARPLAQPLLQNHRTLGGDPERDVAQLGAGGTGGAEAAPGASSPDTGAAGPVADE